MQPSTRRGFLSEVGRGMIAAAIGCRLAAELDLAPALADDDSPERLRFGSLEPLVELMQETDADRLLPQVVERLRGGTPLRDVVAAGSLANARTFGGEDYVGFHTMMAFAPCYRMATQLPAPVAAMPVLKVLYRNSRRIAEHGGPQSEVLHPVSAGDFTGSPDGQALLEAVRRKEMDRAERLFAAISTRPAEDAFDALLIAVQDNSEVHRVVLPYRAWDLLGIVGQEHAHTLLRQSLRYSFRNESEQ
ncbi:MAG: hypothetical protein KJZ87_24920 [Thermoguttaceae bacterium]|nr:hypothetical protein [Thermoguttaceae bacterium]